MDEQEATAVANEFLKSIGKEGFAKSTSLWNSGMREASSDQEPTILVNVAAKHSFTLFAPRNHAQVSLPFPQPTCFRWGPLPIHSGSRVCRPKVRGTWREILGLKCLERSPPFFSTGLNLKRKLLQPFVLTTAQILRSLGCSKWVSHLSSWDTAFSQEGKLQVPAQCLPLTWYDLHKAEQKCLYVSATG